jgi:flagellar protein FlbD
MIQLTRLNSQPLIVNSDLIQFIEKAPDTVLTLVSGEKLVVSESSDQVLEKIVAFRRSILCALTVESNNPPAEHSATAPPPGAEAGVE